METPPSRPLTLFTEMGTVKSISTNKLMLESERAGSLSVYVPKNIPCSLNEHVEVAFEITEHGFIGRRVGNLPVLPVDFLVLSEYLRLGFISIIGMIGFLIIGFFFPVYFLSIILPVLLGFFSFYFYAGAGVIGRHVPNYNHATIVPFSIISPEQYSQFFVTGASPPLIAIDGTLHTVPATSSYGLKLAGGRELPLISPMKADLKKFNDVEGCWIVSFRRDQVDILGKTERNGDISWNLNHLLSLGILFEVSGYVVFFLSVIPGFLMYGFGAPVPFTGDLLASFFISCMFVGCCLILVGKIANLKKKRIHNSIIVDYKSA